MSRVVKICRGSKIWLRVGDTCCPPKTFREGVGVALKLNIKYSMYEASCYSSKCKQISRNPFHEKLHFLLRGGGA